MITWGPVHAEPDRPHVRWCLGDCTDEHGCPGGWTLALSRFCGNPWTVSVQRSRGCWWYRGHAEYVGTAQDTGCTDLDGARAFAEGVVVGRLRR